MGYLEQVVMRVVSDKIYLKCKIGMTSDKRCLSSLTTHMTAWTKYLLIGSYTSSFKFRLLEVGGGHSHERAIWVCLVVKTPFFSLSGRSSDPSFLKFLSFNQKIGIFVEFCISRSHFRPNFSSLPQKFFKIVAL